MRSSLKKKTQKERNGKIRPKKDKTSNCVIRRAKMCFFCTHSDLTAAGYFGAKEYQRK